MGEASRKKRDREGWLEGLPHRQRIVATAALAVVERYVVPARATGMCYRMSFFLREYLADVFDTDVEVVVGYINDGADDIMISHAWVLCDDAITDITSFSTDGRTEPGDLIIVGRVVKPGRAKYTYHRQKGAAGEAVEHALKDDPQYGWIVEQKRREHAGMTSLIHDRAAARSYLDGAPDGLTYEGLARIVGGAR